MTKLSVNVNKLATLRNARGKNNPDVLSWAQDIEAMGAHGITVHPRPDGRHIRFSDVRALKSVVRGEFNIEGFPDEDWLKLVEEVSPHQATLVPDPPDAITSNAGFIVRDAKDLLQNVARRLSKTRLSVFIDPAQFSKMDAKILKEIGIHRIELYTEAFAENFKGPDSVDVISSYIEAAKVAREAGLGINAGHDLTSENLRVLVRHIPWVDEVSIGHALVCDALRVGMASAVKMYLDALKPAGE